MTAKVWCANGGINIGIRGLYNCTGICKDVAKGTDLCYNMQAKMSIIRECTLNYDVPAICLQSLIYGAGGDLELAIKVGKRLFGKLLIAH